MPTNLSLFLAWRYLRGVSGTISTMVKVCFVGIFVSCAALALTMAIMRGFEIAMHEKLQGIHAQLIIRARGNNLNTEKIAGVLNKIPEILAWSPQEDRHVMLQLPNNREIGDVMVLKGIEPDREAQVSKLQRYIIGGNWLTKDRTNAHQVIIGKIQAEQLNVSVGGSINLLYAPEDQSGRKIVLDSMPATIAGIFQTGIEEYDTNVLFCSFSFLEELFPSAGYTQIGVRLRPGSDSIRVLARLKDELSGLDVYSWQDLYPALLSATVLERTVMFIILSLMALVASLSMVALLFMQITYKRSDIAILTALGCPQNTIMRVFLMLGLLITSLATGIGLLVAWVGCLLLQRYPLLQLPDVYFTSHIPVAIEPMMFVLVGGVSMALGLLATWYPMRRARTISVTNLLRHEG